MNKKNIGIAFASVIAAAGVVTSDFAGGPAAEPVARYEVVDQDTYRKIVGEVIEIKKISDDSIYFTDLRSQIFNPTKDGKIQGPSKYERYIAVEKEKQSLIKELQAVKNLGMQSAQSEVDKLISIPEEKL